MVGAGMAGCACGWRLAQAGLNVLVVERGKFAGAKNMWGGAFFGPTLKSLDPEFYKEAPIERFVTRHKFSLINDESCLSMDYTVPKSKDNANNAFITLRSKFDQWMAARVEKAGGIVATGLQANDLLWNGKQVTGILAGKDELVSDVVVACDGVNSILAQKAKLRDELKTEDIKQGVKEVIKLHHEIIEQRCGLSSDEGLTWQFLGNFTKGIPGGGFIYTNKDSLSIGVVVTLKSLSEKKIKADELLECFKKHPEVAKLLEGGKLAEYSAHLIPISGIDMMPKLWTNGFLVAGDAAAFVVGTGLILEGANFAIASGLAAAETIIRAKKKKDFSAKSLSYYQELIEQSFVLKDLKTFKRGHSFLNNSRLYTSYPELLCTFAENVFEPDGKPRMKTWDLLRKTMKHRISLWQVASDLFQAKRSI